MPSVYFAGPLFSLAELEFNQRLATALVQLQPSLRVILPQERCRELLLKPNGLSLSFLDCVSMVTECDLILAILDGADADSGTCVELGLAFAQGKPIIGVRTDFRALEDRGLNLMVSHVCTALLQAQGLTVSALAAQIVAQIKLILP
jgi:nucleoside 2-deoxyribosyltransferase